MRQPFYQLLRKDLRQSVPAMAFFTGAIVLCFIGRSILVALEVPKGLELIALLPLQFLPLWLLWRSVSVWRREWGGNHMLLMLSLPIRGYHLVGAKFLSVMVEMLVYVLVMTAGLYSVFASTFVQDVLAVATPGVLLNWVLQATTMIGLPLFGLVLLVQVAYLAKRLAPRAQWLVFLAALVSGWWLTFRLGALLARLLGWLPRLPVIVYGVQNDQLTKASLYIQVAPLVGVLLVMAGFFWLASRWVERDLEV